MAEPSERTDTANLYDTGVSLMRQFEQLLGKIGNKNQAVDPKPAPSTQLAAGGCCGSMTCTGRPVDTTGSNLTVDRHSPIYMEPSELRLIIKLDTWMADNGNLMVRPSLVEDAKRPPPGVCAGPVSRFSGNCQVEKPLQQPAQSVRKYAQQQLQQLGIVQSQKHQPPKLVLQQQQDAAVPSKCGDAQKHRCGKDSQWGKVGAAGAPVQTNNHQERRNSQQIDDSNLDEGDCDSNSASASSVGGSGSDAASDDCIGSDSDNGCGMHRRQKECLSRKGQQAKFAATGKGKQPPPLFCSK